MDIMMPVMDGYDTIRAIRTIDRFKDLPIIAVTGKAASGERQRCIDAGANDYVPEAGRHRRAARGPQALAADAGRSRLREPDDASRAASVATASGARPCPSWSSTTMRRSGWRCKRGAAAARLLHRRGRLRARRPALRHGPGLRGHPARRPHADHGRVRDRRAHPAAPAVRDDADHLHHCARERRDRHRPLRRRRGRLHLRPRPAGRAARQGVRLRQPLPARPRRSPRRLARCRRRPTSCGFSPTPLRSASSRPTPRTDTSTRIRAGPRSPASRRTPQSGQTVGHHHRVRSSVRTSRPRWLAGSSAPTELSHRFEMRVPDAAPRIVLVNSKVDAATATGELSGWVGHPGRHHRRGRGRGGHGRGPGRGDRGVAAQVRLPGEHEPRDPHADERRHRHDRPAARDRSRQRSNATTRRPCATPARRC